ncbi:MAG: hypothetical protein H6610_02810 [Ignavibacteriales bacterium]|nr:hypothetical protein [Ignavibacteriales bacterium]MCB9218376.1 hypothetical protein [Ignavibacteriales bacterium]MCB9260672.1 hypothetical protein [Ignavibacteriales bacterium]
MNEKKIEEEKIIRDANINNALGIFILVFGIIIIISSIFTETSIGQMTNLIAGILLGLIGFGMIVKSKKNINKINRVNLYE